MTQEIQQEIPLEQVQSEPQESSPSLLQSEAPVESTQESKTDAEWYYDEDTPGVGDKPEWFNDAKYKTLAEQAKAQPGLRKLLGEFSGAPEQYEVSLPKGLEDIEIDNESMIFKTFSGLAKDLNMTQDGFNKLVSQYVELEQHELEKQTEQESEFKKQEIAKLGDGAQETIKNLDQWGKNNLPSELYDTFKGMATTADAIQVLNHLKSKSGFGAIPSGTTAVGNELSRSELRQLMANEKYGRDRDYTTEIDKLYQKHYA